MLRDRQNSYKNLYSIESIDSVADRIVACLNLEEILNNYNTWNHLTVRKQINSPF